MLFHAPLHDPHCKLQCCLFYTWYHFCVRVSGCSISSDWSTNIHFIISFVLRSLQQVGDSFTCVFFHTDRVCIPISNRNGADNPLIVRNQKDIHGEQVPSFMRLSFCSTEKRKRRSTSLLDGESARIAVLLRSITAKSLSNLSLEGRFN